MRLSSSVARTSLGARSRGPRCAAGPACPGSPRGPPAPRRCPLSMRVRGCLRPRRADPVPPVPGGLRPPAPAHAALVPILGVIRAIASSVTNSSRARCPRSRRSSPRAPAVLLGAPRRGLYQPPPPLGLPFLSAGGLAVPRVVPPRGGAAAPRAPGAGVRPPRGSLSWGGYWGPPRGRSRPSHRPPLRDDRRHHIQRGVRGAAGVLGLLGIPGFPPLPRPPAPPQAPRAPGEGGAGLGCIQGNLHPRPRVVSGY